MTATNHALTGALIGLMAHNPWVALPAALLSHLLCDAIPHFGRNDQTWLRNRSFTLYLIGDAVLCVFLVILLGVFHPPYWQLAAICAFIATSPDLLWIRKWRALHRGQAYHASRLENFLANLQWFEKPIGSFVELTWLAGATVILWQFL